MQNLTLTRGESARYTHRVWLTALYGEFESHSYCIYRETDSHILYGEFDSHSYCTYRETDSHILYGEYDSHSYSIYTETDSHSLIWRVWLTQLLYIHRDWLTQPLYGEFDSHSYCIYTETDSHILYWEIDSHSYCIYRESDSHSLYGEFDSHRYIYREFDSLSFYREFDSQRYLYCTEGLTHIVYTRVWLTKVYIQRVTHNQSGEFDSHTGSINNLGIINHFNGLQYTVHKERHILRLAQPDMFGESDSFKFIEKVLLSLLLIRLALNTV
jgi:hypothetical protein